MYRLVQAKYRHGRPYVPDPVSATLPEPFRGLPALDPGRCSGCGACTEACPAAALQLAPLSVDLGRCTFCGACERLCPAQAIRFTAEHRLGAGKREDLVVRGPGSRPSVAPRPDLRARFKRSFKLRQVSAGGCNGCEMELNACGNVNFDMGRYGIEFVASPRHADAIVVTGPVSANMAGALQDTLDATPELRAVIVAGSCAISGGVFAGSPCLDRRFFDAHPPDLYVPGCPPHPLTFIHAVLSLLGRT